MSRRSDVYVLSVKRKDENGTEMDVYDNKGFDEYDGDMEEENNPFIGMNKEELLKYSSSPCWVRFRMACLAFIILAWLGLLISIVVVVMMYPKCTHPESRDWWQSDVMYRVYVRSFKDTDGDGIGDLKGVESKLDYLKDLGIGAISLSPVYTTSSSDSSSSDVSIINHVGIHPDYGTMADMDSLIDQAHIKGIKIILDFIPNHTGKNHPWFGSSSQSNATYKNFYVWADSPTNWRSYTGGDAWMYDSERQQFYLHQMLDDQPDLNLRSSQVQDQLKSVLDFWLSRKVDGFYVRQSAFLFEDYDMRNESLLSGSDGSSGYADYDHRYTTSLPEGYDMIARWKTAITSSSNERVLMADLHIKDVTSLMAYYKSYGYGGADLVINDRFLANRNVCNGTCMASYVRGWTDNIPNGHWPNWIAGDDHSDRFATRFQEPFIRVYYLITMLLPGTPIVYYGDEIKLTNIQASMTNQVGARKQKMRTIMQWNSDANSGFTNNSTNPWVAVNTGYQDNNVDSHVADKESFWHFLKNMTTMRKQVTFTAGDYRETIVDGDIFSFTREFNGEDGYLVAVNLGTKEQTRDFQAWHSGISSTATVQMVVGSPAANAKDDEVDTTSLTLMPLEGVVVSWAYVAKEEL